MTNEKLKAEFNRWIDAGRPKVWVKEQDWDCWGIATTPIWYYLTTYIIDDEHAEVRKAYHDNPDLVIEYKLKAEVKWCEAFKPAFDEPNCEYRIKPKFKVGDKLKKGDELFIVDIITSESYMSVCDYHIFFKDEDEWELVKEPAIERRWRWARNDDGCTVVSDSYMTDKFEKTYNKSKGWYKLENDYIDVTVKS